MPTPLAAEFNAVTKHYYLGRSAVTALENLSLAIYQGEFTFITGASGSGKSTVLNLMGGIDHTDAGQVTVMGTPLDTLSNRQLTQFRRDNIGFIFQSFNLLPVLSVYENVEFPLIIDNHDMADRKAAVEALIEQVGLADCRQRRPNELSGGQRQRVAIARALVSRPRLILADEPTANLDSRTGREVVSLMREMQVRYDTTFVFSSHDPALIAEADTVYELQDGTLCSQQRGTSV